MKLKILLTMGMMVLSACSMKQDPLAGASEVVRMGVPPDKNVPVLQKPLPKESLQIDAPSVVNGTIGTTLSLNISGRIMTPNVGFKIFIDNLADFPGATFDSATGEFNWIPGKAVLAGAPSGEFPLHVSMVTDSNQDHPIITIEKKIINLVIVNSYSKPIVNSVTGPNTVITGSRYSFQFQVEDRDALTAEDVTVNIRDCIHTYSTSSIAHMAYVRKIEADKNTPNKYIGEIVVDLTFADTLRSASYCFAVMAGSKYGVQSDLYKKDVYIDTKMTETKITTDRGPSLSVGEKMNFSFAIYDPKQQGKLSIKKVDDISQLLPGSSLSCVASTATNSQLDCQALIDATTALAQTYVINFLVENRGNQPAQTTTTAHTLRIQVKAATP